MVIDRSSGRIPTNRSYWGESFTNDTTILLRSGGIIVFDESVSYITAPLIPDTPVEFISVEMTILTPRLAMRFELSLNTPISLRMARGAKPIRGLEKWSGQVEIMDETVKRTWHGLCLIGVHGKVGSNELCVLAKAGDLLTVWAVLDEVLGGASVRGARIPYGMLYCR